MIHQPSQENTTRHLLAGMAIPSLTWIDESDPVRQLHMRLNPQNQPGSVLDVITMSHIAPVECLGVLIWLLEKAKWGEFWESYFERIVPRDVRVSYGALIGCKAAARYLREESNHGVTEDPLTRITENAKRLMYPLADEIYALSVFFKQTQAVTIPQPQPAINHEQLLGRRQSLSNMLHPQAVQPPCVVREGETAAPTPNSFLARAEETAKEKAAPSEPTLPLDIQVPMRGFAAIRTDHLANALRTTRIDWTTLISSMPHTWRLSAQATFDVTKCGTLASALLELKRIGELGSERTEDDHARTFALAKALFMSDAYLCGITDPQLRPAQIAAGLWALVLSCGYNLYRPDRHTVTAASWNVRGTLLGRLVLKEYDGTAACPLLNSSNGKITRNESTPTDDCWLLGYFPQVLATLTK